MVQIRSAVHSNYAGMIAMLAADNRVYLGREECYHYQDGLTSYYDNGDGSLCFVTDRADMYYFLYGEGWTHSQAEMLERGLTADQYAEFARLQTAFSGSLKRSGKSCSPGSPSSRPKAICGMRSFTRKDRPAIIICWMAN